MLSKIERIHIPFFILTNTLEHLKLYGAKGMECTTCWRGKLIGEHEAVITAVDCPVQYSTMLGARVDPSEVAKIYFRLYERKEILLGQIHSHPNVTFHSLIDDSYPIVYKLGFLSIVVPDYGFIEPKDFFLKSAVYEYQGQRHWYSLKPEEVKARLKVLPPNFEEELFSRTGLLISQLNVASENSLQKLKESKVGLIISDELLRTYRGQHMLVASVNLLIRSGLNIDVFLPEHNVTPELSIPLIEGNLGSGLKRLSLKINPNSSLQVNPEPREYEVALVIGKGLPIKAHHYIFINAYGWLSSVGEDGRISEYFEGNLGNPIGPVIAACYGSVEIFKVLLNKIAEGRFKLIRSLTFSALNYEINPTHWHNPQLPGKIRLNACLIGAGAIGMAIAYTLASLPTLSGNLTVIDPEEVEVSNLNRYSLATIEDLGIPKVDVIKRKLGDKLRINACKGAYQEFRRSKTPLVIVSVDNVKTRHEVQLDFPRVILNGGMFAGSFTISRHDDFLNKACLGCLYPASSEVSAEHLYPAASFPSMFAGALLGAEILKEQVMKLRDHSLDNAFILNDLFSLPKSAETYLVGRLFEKSDNCGCCCQSSSVIQAYLKTLS